VGRFGGTLVSRCAFLFPGQGSQKPGMGRDLFDAFHESREVFETADRVLDHPISRICFEGTEEELALTENTQPAILTVSIAAFRALEKRGLRPVATAGHSLGEYSAHVAAQTFALQDAIRAVRARGRFMQQAVKLGEGAMAAVIGLDAGEVDRICSESAAGEIVGAANMNGPGQIVIAGHTAAVKRAIEMARAAGAKRSILLPVSAPFHCSLMGPAAEKLEPVLKGMAFSDPALPVYTNVDAAPVAEVGTALAALVRQVTAPVRWQELIEAMLAAGIDKFLEVGPGRVLSGLMKRISKEAKILAVGDPAGVERAVEEFAPGQ
jgi:[acyl-carrier-protein] S-malonyltransferase